MMAGKMSGVAAMSGIEYNQNLLYLYLNIRILFKIHILTRTKPFRVITLHFQHQQVHKNSEHKHLLQTEDLTVLQYTLLMHCSLFIGKEVGFHNNC